jgi:hypothetical protein
MAWKKVTVRTIPDADTHFERMSDEVIAYMKTNYEDTGKRTSFSQSLSDDGLVGTNTSIFKDEDTKNEFLNDSTIKAEIARRNKVNTDNDITTEITVDEEV